MGREGLGTPLSLISKSFVFYKVYCFFEKRDSGIGWGDVKYLVY